MDIYDELEIKKVINGNATLTSLGGSIMPPQVLAAMAEAAQYFVDIDELQAKAGAKIAEWTRNEAAYVSCGAAAGLVLSTAACIAGLDADKRARLPYTEGMKNEVIVHRCGRSSFDFAIRQAGGKLVEIGTEEGEFRVMPDRNRRLVSPDISSIHIVPTKNKKHPFPEPYEVVIEDVVVPGPGENIPMSIDCPPEFCALPGNCG